MKIAVIQQDILWKDKKGNLQQATAAIRRAGKADVYVLPEMFTTGFCMDPAAIAEPEGGIVLSWMRQIAGEMDAAVAGSVAVESNGKYFNRFYFVQPDGSFASYDKRHLFTYGGEDKAYAPGTGRIVVDFRGVRILLQVCYDLRFPVWSRNRGDFDVILYVASWPVNRIAVWDLLLRARAVENQCYVVGANRVGNDPICEYPGHSVVIDPYGHVVAECQECLSGSVAVEIDMPKLSAFRQKFPVLEDGDRFTLL